MISRCCQGTSPRESIGRTRNATRGGSTGFAWLSLRLCFDSHPAAEGQGARHVRCAGQHVVPGVFRAGDEGSCPSSRRPDRYGASLGKVGVSLKPVRLKQAEKPQDWGCVRGAGSGVCARPSPHTGGWHCARRAAQKLRWVPWDGQGRNNDADACPRSRRLSSIPLAGDESSDLIRHFLIESSAKGVHLKGASEELYFGKDGAIARSPGSPGSNSQKPLDAAARSGAAPQPPGEGVGVGARQPPAAARAALPGAGAGKPTFVAVRSRIVQLSPPSPPSEVPGTLEGAEARGWGVLGTRTPPDAWVCVAGSLSAFVYQHAITALALPCKLSIPTRGRCRGRERSSERSLRPVWGGGDGPAVGRGQTAPVPPRGGRLPRL